MTRTILALSLALNAVLFGLGAYAANELGEMTSNFVSRNRELRVSQFEVLRKPTGGIVFFGDSLTQGGLWSELFPGVETHNRGVGGDRISHLLERVDQVYALQPRKLFVMIGINDLNGGLPLETISANLAQLCNGFDRELPRTQVTLQSVLPLNDDSHFHIDSAQLDALNEELQRVARERGYRFVDLRPIFSDEQGMLDRAYSNDGTHLLGPAYAHWRDAIAPLVNE